MAIGTSRWLWEGSGLQWLSVSLRDGQVLAEFPDLQVSSLEYRLEEETSAEVTLPWDNIPDNWQEATLPYSVAILLVRDSVPLWGGIVLSRERVIRDAGISLTLATVEHYLDSVYITDNTFTDTDQCEIMATIIEDGLADHNFNFAVEYEESSITRDRTYEATDDNTVLHYMQNLSNVINGPEFCSKWVMNTDNTFTPVFVIADKIGTTDSVTCTFDESVMTSFDVVEDYTEGYGANRVMATGSTESSDDEDAERPDSGWISYDDENRPVIEYKYQPGSSITEVSTLQSYAQQTLDNIYDGTNQISLELSLLNAPLVWDEWQPGDLIGWNVKEAKEQFPDVYEGDARVIGYTLDFNSGAWTCTPTLEDTETTVSDSSEEEAE